MEKVRKIPRTESFTGPDDGRQHLYPPRRPRPERPRTATKNRREAHQATGLLPFAALVLVGSLAYTATRHDSDSSRERDNRAKIEALQKAAKEQITSSIEAADISQGALVLGEGTKVYAQSDTGAKPIMVTSGIGIVEQPSREQLGKEAGYAYWYRFTMPAEEGKKPAVGWIPASIIDGQQAGFIYNLQGQTGVTSGEYDSVSHMFSAEGQPAAELKLYADEVAANTALAQSYVLPLPLGSTN